MLPTVWISAGHTMAIASCPRPAGPSARALTIPASAPPIRIAKLVAVVAPVAPTSDALAIPALPRSRVISLAVAGSRERKRRPVGRTGATAGLLRCLPPDAHRRPPPSPDPANAQPEQGLNQRVVERLVSFQEDYSECDSQHRKCDAHSVKPAQRSDGGS